MPVAGHELDGADHVVLVDELEERVEAEDRRADRPGQVPADRGHDVGAEHVGEAQTVTRRRGLSSAKSRTRRFGLDAGTARRRSRAGWPAACPRGRCRVLLGRAVDEAGRLHHHVAHRRAGGAGRGEQVHGADHVDLVHGAAGHRRRVDDQEGVHDRVDLGGPHDAAEDRVGLVGADELGPLERDRRARWCRARR